MSGKSRVFTMAGLLLLAVPAWAVKYPESDRVRVEVKVAVAFAPSGTSFTEDYREPQVIGVRGPAFVYTYEVRNLPESELELDQVGVEVPVAVGATIFDTWLFGYRSSAGRKMAVNSGRLGRDWYIWMMSVFPSRPDGTSEHMKNGESLGGLFLASAGLPGIRRFQAWGYIFDRLPNVNDLEDEGPNSGLGVENPEAMNWSSNGYMTTAVGPDVLPATMSNMALLDRLVRLKDEAAKLGWIKDPGVVTSLNQKLANARKALGKLFGGKKAARNMLGAFLNELDALKGKPALSDTAYYMLKVNAEYLIVRMGGRVPAN